MAAAQEAALGDFRRRHAGDLAALAAAQDEARNTAVSALTSVLDRQAGELAALGDAQEARCSRSCVSSTAATSLRWPRRRTRRGNAAVSALTSVLDRQARDLAALGDAQAVAVAELREQHAGDLAAVAAAQDIARAPRCAALSERAGPPRRGPASGLGRPARDTRPAGSRAGSHRGRPSSHGRAPSRRHRGPWRPWASWSRPKQRQEYRRHRGGAAGSTASTPRWSRPLHLRRHSGREFDEQVTTFAEAGERLNVRLTRDEQKLEAAAVAVRRIPEISTGIDELKDRVTAPSCCSSRPTTPTWSCTSSAWRRSNGWRPRRIPISSSTGPTSMQLREELGRLRRADRWRLSRRPASLFGPGRGGREGGMRTDSGTGEQIALRARKEVTVSAPVAPGRS